MPGKGRWALASVLAAMLAGCAADGGVPVSSPTLPATVSNPEGLGTLAPEEALAAIEFFAAEHRRLADCIAAPIRESLGAFQGLAQFAGPEMAMDRRVRSYEIIYRHFNTAEALLVPCRQAVRESRPPRTAHTGLQTLFADAQEATGIAIDRVEGLIREGRRQTTLVTQGNRLDVNTFVDTLRDMSVSLIDLEVDFRERRRPLLTGERIGRDLNEARIHLGRTLSVSIQRSLSFEDSEPLRQRGIAEAAGYRQAIARERAELRAFIQQSRTLPADLQAPARQMNELIERMIRAEEDLAAAFEDYFNGRTWQLTDSIGRLVREIEALDARVLTDMPDLLLPMIGRPTARV